MPAIILLLFLGIPIVEIALFIQAGELIGVWPTLALVVVTAIVGAGLLRLQGLHTLARARESLDRGELPVGEVFTGLCLLAAGALLITPGFFTDTLGLLLFVPAIQRAIGGWVLRTLSRRGDIFVNGERVGEPGPDSEPPYGGGRGGGGGVVIEGDYAELEEPERVPRRANDNRPQGGQ